MKLRSTTRLALPLASAITALLTAQSALATTYYWDVNGNTAGFSTVVGTWNTSNAYWGTSSTGSGGSYTATTTSAADLIIPQATTKTGNLTVSSTQIASSITFAANVGPTVNITGGTIQIGGSGTYSGIYNASSGNNTVSTPLTINSAVSSISISNSGAGTLKTSNVTGLASTGTTQTVNIGTSSSGAITLNGAFADSAAGGKVALNFNNSGSGITTFQSASTYTGGTTFTAGTTVVTTSSIMPTTGGVTFSGGTMQVPLSAWTTGQIDTLLGASTKTSGSLGLDTTSGNLNQWTNFSTSYLGGLGLTKAGSNTLVLDQNNSYTGATTITAGTVQVGSGGSTGSLGSSTGVSLAGSTTLLFNRTGSLAFAGNITGSPTSSAVTITGGLNLTLSGTNTFLGALNVQNGTVSFSNWANNLTGNATVFLGGTAGLGAGTGTLEYTNTDSPTTNKAISLFAGGTGVLQIDNAAASVNLGLGSGNPQITGSGNLVKSGVGTLISTNSHSNYTGTTTIQAGSLVAGADAVVSTAGAFGTASSAIVLGNASTGASDAPALLAAGVTVARDITVGSLSNAAAYNATIGGTNTTGTSNFTGNITLNTTATNYTTTLRAATGGTVNFSTGTWTTNDKAIAIGSAGNTGTVQLSSAITTSGGLSVNYGTLNLNAALTGGVTVASGATLANTSAGSISGATIVNGILATGGLSTIGKLTSGALSFGTGSTFAYDMNHSAVLPGDVANMADLQVVSGNLSLSGTVNLTLNDTAAFAPNTTTLSLIQYSGTWNGGFFSYGGNPLANNASFTDANGNNWRITYNSSASGENFKPGTDTGNFVILSNLTAIPEPTSLLALGCLVGSGALLRSRRRNS